jgi:uncharacterized membrane protein YiaA
MSKALMVVGIVVVFGSLIAYNVSIWKECRQTNSWGYCMHVLSK